MSNPVQFWDMFKKNAVKIIDGVGVNAPTTVVTQKNVTSKFLLWFIYFLVAITILFVVCVQIAEWVWFIPWDSYRTGGIVSTEYLEKSLEKARKYPDLYKTVMITKYSVYSIYITVFILSGLFAIFKRNSSLSKESIQKIISLLWRSRAKR